MKLFEKRMIKDNQGDECAEIWEVEFTDDEGYSLFIFDLEVYNDENGWHINNYEYEVHDLEGDEMKNYKFGLDHLSLEKVIDMPNELKENIDYPIKLSVV